jgi:hypothetical protein
MWNINSISAIMLCILCRHLSRRHEALYKEYQHLRDAQTSDHDQSSMSSFVVPAEGKTYSNVNPRQKLLTQSLVSNLVVKCGLPISIVDSKDFRQFVSDLDPKFSVPCRQTVSQSILPQIWKTQQEKLQGVLNSCTYVALTADIWTDRRAHAFLGVTVHALRHGVPVSHMLAFQAFHGTHTGQKIAESLEAVIADSKLQTKVQYVVTDNASNMIKAISVLFDDGDQYRLDDNSDPSLWEDVEGDEVDIVLSNMGIRLSCFAHSLQLVVRDGLSSVGVIRSALAKCSKLANLLHQSPLFRSAFESGMGSGRSIPATNDTRWNSTYRQLKAIVELDHVKMGNVLRESDHTNLVLSTKDLSQLQELVSILAPFAEATDLTQGQNVVTISCVVPILLSLTKMLEAPPQRATVFTSLVKSLLQGLHDRFHDVFVKLGISHPTTLPGFDPRRRLSFDDGLFLMAAALDPNYAYHWLQDHPGTQEDKQAIRHNIYGMHCLVLSIDNIKIMRLKVFYEFMQLYHSFHYYFVYHLVYYDMVIL